MYEGAGLNRQIRSLGNYDAAIVRVRSRGADIITHRSAAWWRLQLSLAFQQVLQIPTESDTEFKFQCHKTPV
jgi:hypothetical protein